MKNQMEMISGNIVDVIERRIFQGTLIIKSGKVVEIREEKVKSKAYILPGFIDAHVHIESSMMIPSEFARLAVVHGTVGTVSDPHEISNVMGVGGIKFMIENGKKVPFNFNFGAPSCVPPTAFETSGAVISKNDIEALLLLPEIKYLSEMMNVPGVLFGDQEVTGKIEMANKLHKPIDGHAPGLRGPDLVKYINTGISTDHECFSIDEAREKIAHGMKILIREGSAAKNFDTLYPLIDEFPDMVMLCSDDKHPDDLVRGHINCEVKRAIALGCGLINVLRSCTVNPVRHYNLDIGLLQVNDPADFIIVDNLKDFNILSTRVHGIEVAKEGKSLINSIHEINLNNFNIHTITADDLEVHSKNGKVKVIEAIDGQLITHILGQIPKILGGCAISDPSRDFLKIAVVNRYSQSPVATGFISGFGLKNGAIASSVAHDCHNIVAVGVDDGSIADAINLVISGKGGISAIHLGEKKFLPLPVAGIMSGDDGYELAKKYKELHVYVKKQMGSNLTAPYMTLSFMALLVIPDLKLSDKGLFDGTKFSFTSLFYE